MSAKVLIGMPTTGQVRLQAMASLQGMIASTREATEIRVVFQPGPAIEKSRNQLAAQFLDMADYTHMLLVGANLSFPVEGLNRLLRLDAPLAAGVYPELRSRLSAVDGSDRHNVTTSLGRSTVAGVPDRASDAGSGRVMYHWLDAYDLDETPATFDAAGAGFCLIRRDVLEAVERPWFRSRLDAHANYVPDDIEFCRRVRDAGFDIVADPVATCDLFKVMDLSRIEELFTDDPSTWPWADTPAAPRNDGEPKVMIATVGPDEWIEPAVSDFVFQQLSAPWSRVANVSYNFGVDWAPTCNQLFDEFLDRSHCSHLLMLGNRVAPPPAFLDRALGLRVPVAAGCYRVVVDNEVFYDAGLLDDDGQVTLLSDVDDARRDRPSVVDYVGLSATLIAREALERLRRPILPPDADRNAATAALCRRFADEAGIRPALVPLPCRAYEEIGLKALLDLKQRLHQQAATAMS